MLKGLRYGLGCAGIALFAWSMPAIADDTSELMAEDDDEYGEYLVTDEGRSVYMFEADSTDESVCYDDCADAWPPLEPDNGTPTAGDGVDEDMLGTMERDDGTEQVTYGGQPLYLFVRDTEAGDTSGHEVEGFGDDWYLVSPDGDRAGQDHSEAVGSDPETDSGSATDDGSDATGTDSDGSDTDSDSDTNGSDNGNGSS